MNKYIYDESNGLWYELQRDYYIPCLTLPAEKENKPIGLWGQRHKRYLQEHKRAFYATLLTSGKLNAYLADVDKQAEERVFCQVLFPEKSVEIPCFRQGIFPTFGGH